MFSSAGQLDLCIVGNCKLGGVHQMSVMEYPVENSKLIYTRRRQQQQLKTYLMNGEMCVASG